MKNLLDWTVGGGKTYDSLRRVLQKTGADIVETACRRIPVTKRDIGPEGLVEAAQARTETEGVLAALADQWRPRGVPARNPASGWRGS